MKALMADAAKRHPEINVPLPKFDSQGSTSTETHENIVVNQKFSDKDFVP
jgi:hypothetical protein